MNTPVSDGLVVPGAPDLVGLRFRRFRGPDDYPGLAAANQVARDDAGILEVVTAASMANTYEHLTHSDPATDMIVAERHGRIVGYGRVEWRDLVDGSRAFATVGLLEPFERGQGIGGAMLDWLTARAREIAARMPDREARPMHLGTTTWAKDLHAVSLLHGRGWTERGRGYEMLRSTLDDIPVVPVPAGLQIRPAGPDDRRSVWDAAIEAFRDHRAEPEPTEEDRERFFADARQDPSLWVVAFDGNEVAGSVLGLIDEDENAHHGRARGIIDEVSVRRPWRRRGLARALVATALAGLRDRGMTSAHLEVDGLNPNQAMTLYESLGFEISSTTIDWSRPL